MLGKHADAFFARSLNERVIAKTPNGDGRSMPLLDREQAGTKTTRVRGGFSNPGPQRTVSSSFVPGLGCASPAQLQGAALPGMGGTDGAALPGMGSIFGGSLKTPMIIALAVAGGLAFLSFKR